MKLLAILLFLSFDALAEIRDFTGRYLVDPTTKRCSFCVDCATFAVKKAIIVPCDENLLNGVKYVLTLEHRNPPGEKCDLKIAKMKSVLSPADPLPTKELSTDDNTFLAGCEEVETPHD
jgi:hypothetical protein